MALGLLGTKVGMTQVYTEDGSVAPVTVLQLGPCPVLQIRTQDKDGYSAVQMGYLDKPRRKATRAERGHVSSEMESKRRKEGSKPLTAKAEVEPQRYVREFRVDGTGDVEVGTVLTAGTVFAEIKSVDVTATSKGRGTTGVMKRHGFSGLRASHGIKKGQRQRGSSSSRASNRGLGRLKKGIRMAGRHGNSRVTIRNLKVVRIDADNHILLVKGAVPGPNGGFVMVRPTNKQ